MTAALLTLWVRALYAFRSARYGTQGPVFLKVRAMTRACSSNTQHSGNPRHSALSYAGRSLFNLVSRPLI